MRRASQSDGEHILDGEYHFFDCDGGEPESRRNVECTPDNLGRSICGVELSEAKFGDQLCKHLGRIFGSCSADEAGTTLTVEVDSKSAEIALPGLTVKSEDTAWAQHLTVVSRRFRMTVKPEFR